MTDISMGICRYLLVILCAASGISGTACVPRKQTNSPVKPTDGNVPSGSGKMLEGRTYSYTFKCRPMGAPENIPPADCKNEVSFLKNGMASYNSGVVDTIQVLPYSITDHDIKLTDSNFAPPQVYGFKMSSDEKTIVDSDGIIL